MNESQNPSALRSKQQIIDALLKLMDIYPYKEISVKQIILETDLVRKTFYRNFSSKDDVLDAYINSRIFEYTQALLDQDNPLDVIFAFCDKNRQMLELLQKNDMLHILLKRLNDVIPHVNESADFDRNPFKQLIGDLEPDYLIAFNVGAIWNVICKWVERGMDEPFDKVKKILEEYIARLNVPVTK